MLRIDHERRRGARLAVSRPCKVFEPRSGKYRAGMTRNISAGGMLLRLDRTVHLEPGDRLFIAVARRRVHGLLRSCDMLEATVVRARADTSGESMIAVVLHDPPTALGLPLLLAA